MKKYFFIFGIFILLLAQNCFALSYEKVLKNSNAKKAYQKEDYAKAEELFKQSSIEYPEDGKIHYNLANTHYKNEKYDEAIAEYEASMKNEDINKAKVLYSIGDSYFQKQDYQKAIEYYRDSLIENPRDADTKYNYELTRQYLQQQQEQQQQDQDQDKQDQDQQDQEQEQQDKQQQNQDQQEQDQEEQQQEEQQQQDQEQQNEQEQQNQPQPTEEEKKQAERILDAMQRAEDDNQKERMKKLLQQDQVKKVDKNW